MSDQNNGLILPSVESTLKIDDGALDKLSQGTSWLPSLRLMQAGSNPVKKREFGGIQGGQFLLVRGKDDGENLGDEVHAFVLHRRPKALRLVNNSPESQSYDPSSELFASIQQEADSGFKGTAKSAVSSMYGPEFLLYIPKANNGQGAFGLFFCSSKTNRKKAKDLWSFQRGACTLTGRYIETAVHSWFGFDCRPCTAALKSPTEEEMVTALKIFLNPRSDTKEAAVAEGIDR